MSTTPSAECLAFLKRLVPESRFDEFMKACSIFEDILYETNRTMNLTRIPPEEFWSKHIADQFYGIRNGTRGDDFKMTAVVLR